MLLILKDISADAAPILVHYLWITILFYHLFHVQYRERIVIVKKYVYLAINKNIRLRSPETKNW